MVKTAEHIDMHQAINAIYGFFKQVNDSCKHETPATQAEIEPFLTKNFQLNSNGQTVCRSSADYLTRLQKFQKKYSRFECSKPVFEPVTEGNRIAFQYKVDLTSRSGQHKQVFITAIATIEHNKMISWYQTAHQQGTGDWDA
jgi:hypothetical protein